MSGTDSEQVDRLADLIHEDRQGGCGHDGHLWDCEQTAADWLQRLHVRTPDELAGAALTAIVALHDAVAAMQTVVQDMALALLDAGVTPERDDT